MKQKKKWLIVAAAVLVAVAAGGGIAFAVLGGSGRTAAETMDEYIAALNNGAYDEMYELLDEESQKETDQETFTERNKNIYEGIEASNITVEITDEGSENRTSGQTTQHVARSTPSHRTSPSPRPILKVRSQKESISPTSRKKNADVQIHTEIAVHSVGGWLSALAVAWAF